MNFGAMKDEKLKLRNLDASHALCCANRPVPVDAPVENTERFFFVFVVLTTKHFFKKSLRPLRACKFRYFSLQQLEDKEKGWPVRHIHSHPFTSTS